MTTHLRSVCLSIAGIILIALIIFSGIKPYDQGTWFLEVLPVILILPILFFSYQKFPLTSLLYFLIFMHACVLIVGGTYTYARVPFGFSIQEYFELARNPYDKIGHFMQGLVPALAAREIFIRKKWVKPGRVQAFLVICVVLAVSASYELIEWAAAMSLGQGAEDFLGTQGDIWDTQQDMLWALIGAICTILFLSRWHNRQIKNLSITFNQ
jgi:putative membrane protein